MTDDGATMFACTACGKVMSSYREVGYEGPTPGSGVDASCWMPGMEWLVLCQRCADDSEKIRRAIAEGIKRSEE